MADKKARNWTNADEARYQLMAKGVVGKNGKIDGRISSATRAKFTRLEERRARSVDNEAEECPAVAQDAVLPDSVPEAEAVNLHLPADYAAKLAEAGSPELPDPEGQKPEPPLPLTQLEIIALEQMHQRAMGPLTPMGPELGVYRELLARWDATTEFAALETAEYGAYLRTMNDGQPLQGPQIVRHSLLKRRAK